MRQCGDCQLCCKLLPMSEREPDSLPETKQMMVEAGMLAPNTTMTPDFFKPAGATCPHQRHHVGCTIYWRRPFGCRVWMCRWLGSDDTRELSRPDRSHYVVDMAPDYVSIDDENIPVLVVWVDPDYPDAHRDPALRRFLAPYARQQIYALIRYSATKGMLLAMDPGGKWHEIWTNNDATREHTAAEKYQVLGSLLDTVIK
jgi:hypothetical protein